MKCFNCNKQSTSFYSPRELTKAKIMFCRKCLELIKNQDLRYLENQNEQYSHIEVKKLIRKRGDNNVLK